MPTSSSLTALSASAAAAELAASRLTSAELSDACIARIEARDAAVAAWAHFDATKVRADAVASDRARAAGERLGTLAGIPVGIKDIIDTADYPTECGTPVFAGRQPDSDASVVTQLKAAGALIFGKTVTTELAFFGPGKTKNPVNPAHTPGGSSSGSAAAVADGQVPLALGTQTAGSIIRPASYCGVIGYKPTFGAVSRVGVLEQSAPLDTIGGYARTVRDIALLMDAISAFDARDPDMSDGSRAALTATVDSAISVSPKFAFVRSPAWAQADAEARQTYEGFAHRLASRTTVTEIALPLPFDTSLRLQQIVQFSDIARNYGPIADANSDRITAKLKEIIAEGRTFSAAQYADARAKAEPLYQTLADLIAGYDVILTPAAQGVALKGLTATGSPMFNALWTYLGMPCISLPLLTIDGLPLGVQLVGRRGADGALLRIADWLMRAAA